MEGAECGIMLIHNARWTSPKNTKTFFNKRLFKTCLVCIMNEQQTFSRAWERRGVPLFKMYFCVVAKNILNNKQTERHWVWPMIRPRFPMRQVPPSSANR